MKKISNFHEKSELPKFIHPVKISWLTFSAVSGVEMKHLQRSAVSRLTFSSRGFAAIDLARAAKLLARVLQREPTRRLSCCVT